MQILVTSSRMPYALSEIRAFSRMGHTVHSADTFAWAPGNHSVHASEHHETVSPRKDPDGYVSQLNMLVDMYRLDLVVPTFEEVFYLSRHGRTLGQHGAEIFAPEFETLCALHDKTSFARLASELGLHVATPKVCTTREQFEEAIAAHAHWFARAAFSRAGSGVCTNTGPLAEQSTPEDVQPTPDAPWIVQPFIEGEDLCSFSVVRHGKLVCHSTYRHPKELDNCGGIVFESLVDPRTLDAAQRIAEHMNYHGQMSLDFIDGDDGNLYLVECNPRPTAGVSVMPPSIFVPAVLGEFDGQAPHVAPAGLRRHIGAALLRDMVVHPGELWSDLQEMFSDAKDVYFDDDDPMPGLYQFLSLFHVLEHRRENKGHENDKLSIGYLHDICWDGASVGHGPADAHVTPRQRFAAAG